MLVSRRRSWRVSLPCVLHITEGELGRRGKLPLSSSCDPTKLITAGADPASTIPTPSRSTNSIETFNFRHQVPVAIVLPAPRVSAQTQVATTRQQKLHPLFFFHENQPFPTRHKNPPPPSPQSKNSQKITSLIAARTKNSPPRTSNTCFCTII